MNCIQTMHFDTSVRLGVFRQTDGVAYVPKVYTPWTSELISCVSSNASTEVLLFTLPSDVPCIPSAQMSIFLHHPKLCTHT